MISFDNSLSPEITPQRHCGVEKGDISMDIEKLFVVSSGDPTYDFEGFMLSSKGVHQSELLAQTLVLATAQSCVLVFYLEKKKDKTGEETAKIICSKIHSVCCVTGINTDGNADNCWPALDFLYNHGRRTVILITDVFNKNRITKYFCEDNEIPFSYNKTISNYSGYEIDCKNRKCQLIDWSRGI